MASTAQALGAKTRGPVIVDLGKRKRKDIKQLRNGTGKLVDEIMDCIDELAAAGSLPSGAQPLILLVREKPKLRKAPFPIY